MAVRRNAEAQTVAANGNHIDWVEADALHSTTTRSTGVLAVECIFHFPSRERFLAEAARVLKPGGYLVESDFVPTVAFSSASKGQRMLKRR